MTRFPRTRDLMEGGLIILAVWLVLIAIEMVAGKVAALLTCVFVLGLAVGRLSAAGATE